MNNIEQYYMYFTVCKHDYIASTNTRVTQTGTLTTDSTTTA